MFRRKRTRMLWCLGILALPGIAAALHASALVDLKLPPFLVGDVDRGYLRTELYRGASVPDELLILATPNNCSRDLTLEIAWDEGENEVNLKLTGKGALEPRPNVVRTEGVDYHPNPWWPEAKDIENGKYVLWLIHVVGLTEFYYSPFTLDLLGSEYDFDVPPEPAITIHVPGFVAVPTDFIEPDENGDVNFTHTFAYDGLVRGDLPEYTHFFASFVPQNLCFADPHDYTRTSSRPYASATRPASEALPFSEYLRNGLIFDITVEPENYHQFPPISTNVAVHSQALTLGGGIPRGWTNDLEAVFANLAPPIRPWEGAATCENWFKPVRNRDFNACAAPGGAEGGAQ
jgi:hypothetical protein